MKHCTTCNTTKPFEQFYKDKNSSDGHNKYCKACRQATFKKWYATGKAKEKTRKRGKEEYAKNKVRSRYNGIFRRFGLTESQYNIILIQQNYCCAICHKAEYDPRHKHLSVDHDHLTGKIRGLLCNNCNKALGQFMDNTDYLQNAIDYLNSKHGSIK